MRRFSPGKEVIIYFSGRAALAGKSTIGIPFQRGWSNERSSTTARLPLERLADIAGMEPEEEPSRPVVQGDQQSRRESVPTALRAWR